MTMILIMRMVMGVVKLLLLVIVIMSMVIVMMVATSSYRKKSSRSVQIIKATIPLLVSTMM